MYSTKDIQFVGKYDYDKASAERFASYDVKTFSVNIFKWGLKSNGRQMKPLKGVVRVVGSPSDKEKVFDFCEKVVKELDAGIWDGRKTVVVK